MRPLNDHFPFPFLFPHKIGRLELKLKTIYFKSETMPTCSFDKLTDKSVPHILERIFFSLDYKSFKNSMEVSQTWRNFLTSELFQPRAKSKFYEEIHKDLIQALEKGLIEDVKSILSNFMVDVDCAIGIHGYTSLLMASSHGHKNLVDFLLDKGADPNKANSGGWTPLHFSIYRRHDYVVQLLLQRGSDPNTQAAYGDSPLYWAAYNGNKFVAELLINRGANILNENRGGNTALHAAAYYGNKDVVKLLLDHGASPKAQNHQGENALALAYRGSRYRQRVKGCKHVIKILAPLS